MTSGTLNDNQRKAALSFACLAALSAVAGFTCEKGPEPDVWKVDGILRSGGHKIDVQLKSTSSPQRRADGLHFRLDRPTYDTLRDEDRLCPIVLVVLELPENPARWLERTSESLIMRRCLWWESLTEYPEIDMDSKVIVIPGNQQLDPATVEKLMGQTRQRQPLKEQGL